MSRLLAEIEAALAAPQAGDERFDGSAYRAAILEALSLTEPAAKAEPVGRVLPAPAPVARSVPRTTAIVPRPREGQRDSDIARPVLRELLAELQAQEQDRLEWPDDWFTSEDPQAARRCQTM